MKPQFGWKCYLDCVCNKITVASPLKHMTRVLNRKPEIAGVQMQRSLVTWGLDVLQKPSTWQQWEAIFCCRFYSRGQQVLLQLFLGFWNVNISGNLWLPKRNETNKMFITMLQLELLWVYWSRTQNYWASGLYPQSGVLNSRKPNVSKTWSVSVLRWERWHLLPSKELTSCPLTEVIPF
jgi:hypothetical protein